MSTSEGSPAPSGSGFRHDERGTPAAHWRERPEWPHVPVLDLSGPRRPARVVVCAAHPDDESLGAGGLVRQMHLAGVPVHLALATAGERSHPRSPTTTPDTLGVRRLGETERAWAVLGGSVADIDFWGLPDGALTAHEAELVYRLVDLVDDGRHTLLVAPWRHDGHPDHDALGRAARTAAYRTGARLLQYPVWFWHHATGDQAPWPHLTRHPLDGDAAAAKAEAVASHATQVAPLSPRAGDETLLGADLLQHFAVDFETYVDEPPADTALDQLHRDVDDPWGTETRWYEQRKRDLILASLPQPHYERALDVGCSTGTLTEALASRCTSLLAIDDSAAAVDAARHRLRHAPGVQVRTLTAPMEWPDGDFDLIVVSESGYFLSPAGIEDLVVRVAGSLASGGTLLLAHWRHPLQGWPRSGPHVHATFRDATGIPPVAATYRDADVEVLVHAHADALPRPAAQARGSSD